MRRTVTIRGSYGNLIAHAATGLVIGGNSGEFHWDGEVSEEYADIVRFDPSCLLRETADHGETDILMVGYWTNEGVYIEPYTYSCTTNPGDKWPCHYIDAPLRFLAAPA